MNFPCYATYSDTEFVRHGLENIIIFLAVNVLVISKNNPELLVYLITIKIYYIFFHEY